MMEKQSGVVRFNSSGEKLLSSWYNAGGAAAPTTTPEPPPHVPPNCPPCAGATLTAWTPDPSIWRPDQQAGSPMCSTAGALLEWTAELHATTCSLHPQCLVFFIGLDKLNIGRLIRIVVFVLVTWVAVAVSPVLVETRVTS
ncbi:hypothetical protein NQZ68_000381 [Dissostichus eleginoides]|nr:hypothetical protein NQZ68_000381 [Dissostichus eleginoides]